MMREIKFRCWDKEENRMRDWKNLLAIGYGQNKIMDSEIDDSIFNDEQFELMQFTNLYDKNGKEIYEGDIVIGDTEYFVCNVKGVVKYSGMSFVCEGEKEQEKYGSKEWYFTAENPNLTQLKEIEVIGNIYMNNDLLK